MSLRKLTLAGFLAINLLFSTGCQPGETAPVKKVASIDNSAIYSMEIFTKPQEELDAWVKEEIKKRGKAVEGKTDEEKAKALQDLQVEVEKKRNETLDPLKKKAEAAVARAAADKGITVILDKKIVVHGVDDITEDVSALLKGDAEITYPEDQKEKLDKAPIGYFDPSIVYGLKVFKEAQGELMQEKSRLEQSIAKELQKAKDEGRQPSAAEMQALKNQVQIRLESLQEQKMTPLKKAVSDAVTQVAKEEGLSLVLDTQHVMYGGRNLNDEVVEVFLKNVGDVKTEKPAEEKPAPAETPAPAEG